MTLLGDVFITIYQMLPLIGIISFASGIICGVHNEAWGDTLIFPRRIQWGFAVCIFLFLGLSSCTSSVLGNGGAVE